MPLHGLVGLECGPEGTVIHGHQAVPASGSVARVVGLLLLLLLEGEKKDVGGRLDQRRVPAVRLQAPVGDVDAPEKRKGEKNLGFYFNWFFVLP